MLTHLRLLRVIAEWTNEDDGRDEERSPGLDRV
jgi:hypothetical protein